MYRGLLGTDEVGKGCTRTISGLYEAGGVAEPMLCRE